MPSPHRPLPYLSEHQFKYTRRQPHSYKIRPPKLEQKQHEISLNNSLSAQAISFKEDSISASNNVKDDLLNSIHYNKDSLESYFEQCFEIIEKIGEGSFAEVFKVRCKEDGLLYAIKKSKKLLRNGKYREERLEEVRRYEQFSENEHCVKLYKAWEQEGYLYMQMELCRENLENYLSRKCDIPEEKIWSILLDLLLAIKCLHDKNLVHLDIKLDNILIDEDEYCKLGDFGLVVDVDQANICQTTEGDSRYIAPEIMSGYFSKAADVFSLGIAILELSCNLELPPHGPLWHELRMGILPKQFMTKLSLELKYLIKCMMNPYPYKRPTVDELLLHRRLVALQKRRNCFKSFKKFYNYYKRINRLISTKLSNVKNFVKQFFVRVFNLFTFNDKNSTTEQTPNRPINSSSAILSSQKQLDFNFHSTPLNHNSVSLRKSKRYLEKRSSYSHESYFSISKLNLEDGEELDSTPIICKQLFGSDDDSDY